MLTLATTGCSPQDSTPKPPPASTQDARIESPTPAAAAPTGSAYDERVVLVEDAAEAAAMQASLAEKGIGSMAKMSVARLRIGEELIEVSSLLPLVHAGTTGADGPALTVFGFNDKQDQLVMFSRHSGSGEAFRFDVPVEQFGEGQRVRFPIVSSDGGVEDRTIELVAVRSR